MRCLWLTWMDPRGGMSGELIYSRDLIQAVASAGFAIDVLCLSDGGVETESRDGSGVQWHTVNQKQRGALRSLASTLPNIACRAAGSAMRGKLQALLEGARWDCVVVDGIFSGWALDAIVRFGRGTDGLPRLVYVAHNHEGSLRHQVASNYPGSRLKRQLLFYDAWKALRLEQRLLHAADLITAITPEDRVLFHAAVPHRDIIVLPPGYGGRRVLDRCITESTPRRAVIVGSFDWIAKKMNLAEFLAVADPLFAREGVELLVVGRGSERRAAGPGARLAATTLVGAVDSTDAYLDSARLAVVPERTGGGFKLKVLEYVFNGLPVAGFSDSGAGTPLVPGESIATFDSHSSLAQGVLDLIDDLPRLNLLRSRAITACARQFDWSSRGRGFVDAVTAL